MSERFFRLKKLQHFHFKGFRSTKLPMINKSTSTVEKELNKEADNILKHLYRNLAEI